MWYSRKEIHALSCLSLLTCSYRIKFYIDMYSTYESVSYNFDKVYFLKRIAWLEKVVFLAERFSFQILLRPKYLNATHKLDSLYKDLDCPNNNVISENGWLLEFIKNRACSIEMSKASKKEKSSRGKPQKLLSRRKHNQRNPLLQSWAQHNNP